MIKFIIFYRLIFCDKCSIGHEFESLNLYIFYQLILSDKYNIKREFESRLYKLKIVIKILTK
jgi:hypothetical protein